MFSYFIWHCSIPYYQANTGYWSCRNGIIMPNCYPLVIQLHRHINFAMNKWQKLMSVACIDLASATYAPVSCVCVQEVSSDRSKLSRKKSEICFVGVN